MISRRSFATILSKALIGSALAFGFSIGFTRRPDISEFPETIDVRTLLSAFEPGQTTIKFEWKGSTLWRVKVAGEAFVHDNQTVENSRGNKCLVESCNGPQQTECCCYDSLIPLSRDYLSKLDDNTLVKLLCLNPQ